MKIISPIGMASLVACGGSVSETPDAGALARVGADGSPFADVGAVGESPIGVGPIDASGEPSELGMICPTASGHVALKLPCQLGANLNGTMTAGYHELECKLSGDPDTPSTVPISLIVPLAELAMRPNQPVQIPFDTFPAPPTGSGGRLASYPGEHFFGTLTGTAIFSQVDPMNRAFVGRLQQARFDWIGDKGDSFSCTVADGPFWAVAGAFL